MRAVIIGASSAIASAVCRELSEAKAELFLVARNPDRLQAMQADLRIRGAAAVEIFACDLTDEARHDELLTQAREALGGIDLILIAHGLLVAPEVCERNFRELRRMTEVNYLSVASLLLRGAALLERQGKGTLAVISSVAADRGRAGNYPYAATKAAVDALASGLRGRLRGTGVQLLNLKPGFVDSPMTAGRRRNFLYATPEKVAHGILRAVSRRRAVAYLPGFWVAIMFVIRALPESMFQRIFGISKRLSASDNSV
jgi:short-subunit dehydrogenase